MERPGRPLGVSLAIIASLLVFTISPLLQVGLLFVVRQHFVDQSLPSIEGEPVVSGGDIIGIPASTLIIQAALAVIFLAAAVFAWRGRPSRMRFVLIVLVIIYTGIKFATIISASMAQQNLQVGVSSLDSIMQSVSAGEFVTEFLVMLYVVWYMNRGPARAFYRGYYLPDPAAGTASSPEEPAS
jgi:hypothetical protein